MQRRSGLWIASTPTRVWKSLGRPMATRKCEVGLRFDGTMEQLWEGFGGGVSEMGWTALSSVRAVERARALNALFNHDEGCHLQYMRVPVGASTLALGDYCLDDTPNDLALKQFSIARDKDRLIPFLRVPLLRIRRCKVIASPWSPPAWMKEQAGQDCGRIIWNPMMLEAYALYLLRFVEEYRQVGVPINHVMIQNEPGSGDRRPGCLWTGGQLRDFIRNHLGPLFARKRGAPKIWLGALDSPDYSAQAVTVLNDPKALQFLAGVACQKGGEEILARIHKMFPDIQLMHSDCGVGDGQNTWEQAHATFGTVQRAIASGANTCLYDNLIFPVNGRDLEGRGRNSLMVADRAGGTVVATPDYHVIRHFSGLVDRYAVRLGLEGAWACHAAAFYNEADESRVLVIQNPDPEDRRVVLEDRDRLLALPLSANSFNTIVL